MTNQYRIKIKYPPVVSEKTSNKGKIREWGYALEEKHLNSVIVVQRKDADGWCDWRLLEDF